ncbi:MAG: hypothetical protein V3W00_08490, partial [Candidatus Brocadiales bacterium]
MRFLLGVTVACLVSLFTVGSPVVAQEDPIFDILKGNFGGETGGMSGEVTPSVKGSFGGETGGVAGG